MTELDAAAKVFPNELVTVSGIDRNGCRKTIFHDIRYADYILRGRFTATYFGYTQISIRNILNYDGTNMTA